VTGGVTRVLVGNVVPGVNYATVPGSLYVQENLEVDGNVYLGDAVTDNLTVTGILSLTGGANYLGPITISTTNMGALVVRQQSNGTQIFNVDTENGNVGIGSAVPGVKLDVAGDIRSSSLTAGRITYAATAGQLTDNENLVFNGTNVGIGTPAPRAKLEVDGAIFIDQEAAPSPATDRLYNTAGNLFWSGSQLALGAALTWNVVGGTSQAMSVNNGYVANNGALVTITLPATAAQGTVVAVTGGLSGAGGWKLAQNAGQIIHFGSVATTTGVTGYLSSNNQFDGVQLLCVQANTDFVVIASQGNITYF
jgi:hypothetical protein